MDIQQIKELATLQREASEYETYSILLCFEATRKFNRKSAKLNANGCEAVVSFKGRDYRITFEALPLAEREKATYCDHSMQTETTDECGATVTCDDCGKVIEIREPVDAVRQQDEAINDAITDGVV